MQEGKKQYDFTKSLTVVIDKERSPIRNESEIE